MMLDMLQKQKKVKQGTLQINLLTTNLVKLKTTIQHKIVLTIYLNLEPQPNLKMEVSELLITLEQVTKKFTIKYNLPPLLKI